MRLQSPIVRQLSARRHTTLLIAIIAMLAVRAFLDETAVAAICFSLGIVVVMLAALFAIQIDDMVGEREVLLKQRRRRTVVGWFLVVPALVERVWAAIAPNPLLIALGAFSWLLFFVYVTGSQLRSLLKQREITNETISMSVSIYLLLGMCWTLLYVFIYTRHPEAFQFPTPVGEAPDRFATFVYFSLTTLSTIGYGDITPLTLQARYAAVAEGITGQFYLAVLVARLVGIQMSHATKPPPDNRQTEHANP